MPQQWQRLDFDKGISLTKHESLLDPGEVKKISAFRYVRGDNAQLHRDVGTTVFGDMEVSANGAKLQLTSLEYISFEDSDSHLLAFGQDTGTRKWSFATAIAALERVEPFWIIRAAAKLVEILGTRMAAIHSGNQYFVGGGGADSYVVSAVDDWKVMGMRTQEDVGVANTGTEWVQVEGTLGLGPVFRWWLQDPRKMGLISDIATITNVNTWDDGASLGFDVSADDAPSVFDGFVFWVTEYDKDLDVESVPYYAQYVQFVKGADTATSTSYLYGFHSISHQTTGGTVHDPPWRPQFDFKGPLGTGYVKKNPRATHLRLYRGFIGNAFNFTASNESAYGIFAKIISGGYRTTYNDAPTYTVISKQTGNAFVQGGFVDQVEIDDASPIIIDPIPNAGDPVSLPWTYNGTSGFYRQMPPQPFDRGVMHGEQVLTNITLADRRNVLQYSIVGFPEYFPRNHVLPITTDGADAILAMHSLGDTTLVLTPSGVHRVNYLPGLADSERHATEQISTNGVVNDEVSTVITMPQGLVLVWLARDTLRLSSGRGDVNACEDFSVAATGLLGVETWNLYNNYQQERLELAALGTMYHFYYSRNHLKPGGFKMTGPHAVYQDVPIRDANGDVPNRADVGYAYVQSATAQGVAKKIDSYVWVGTTDGVIVLNQNLTGEDLYVHMGRISNRREPLDRITLHGVALQHSAVDRVLDSGGNQAHKIQARVQGKSRNNEPNPSKTLDFVGQHFDEVDHLSIRGGASGNYVTLELLYDGKDDQAWGPLYAEMEGMPDGG